jgi:hypothetical protein
MKQSISIIKYLALFMVCLFTSKGFGQAPANDNCANATSLPCGTSNLAGTTVGSISEIAPSGCANAFGVWYTFTGNGQLTTISSTAASGFDHEIDIFSGGCGSLTNIACVDGPGAGGTENYTFTSVNGTTYYIYVAHFSTSGSTRGAFTISRTCVSPPTNDDPSGATPITAGASCSYTTFTNAGASASTCGTIPAPGCASYSGSDVWFSIIVPASGIITFDSQTGVVTDGGMAIYSGTPCGVLTLLGCDDDASANGSMPSITVSGQTPGATLYVRFWELGNDNNGTFGLCATTVIVPANDNCSGAFPLTVNSGTTCVSTTTASSNNATQSLTGCSGNADDDVWFSFIATSTSHSITVTPNSLSNVVFQVFSGSCGSLTTNTCVNSTTGSNAESSIITGLTNGTTYFVRVYSNGNSTNSGTFTICVTTPPTPPANDNCSNATPLPCGTSNLAGTTVASISETAPSGCASAYGVWYTFTGNGQITTINSTAAAGFDHEIDIFSGTCGSLSNIVCENSSGAGGTESHTFTAANGTTYYIYVAYYTSGTTTGAFTISRTCITPPANDDCSSSFTVPVNAAGAGCVVTSTATSFGATQSQAACTGSGADDDVWFSFTATATNHTVTVTPGTMNDVVIQVFNGACGSLTSNQCIDNNGGSSAEVVNLSGLTIGTTYYFRVFSLANAAGAGTFTVCVTTPPIPPTNDNCANATPLPCGTSNLAGTTVASISETAPSACASAYGVWYTFTGNGQITTISSTAAAGFDHEIDIFSGSCGSLTNIVCEDGPGAGGTESYTFTAVNGTTYYIYVAYFVSGTTTGTFTISRTCITPPANDNCPNATPAAVSPGLSCTTLTNGTLLGATASSQANGCTSGYDDNDVWYSFVAASSSHSITINNVNGNQTDLYHSVYAGSCASVGPAIVCSDPDNSTVNGLILGNTYYIRIYTRYSATNANTTFSVCIKTPPPTGPCGNPANNDYCSNPATLTQGPGTFSSSTSSIYSSDQASPLSSIFCGTIENNSWYSFVATSSTASFPFTAVNGCTWNDGVQAQVYRATTNVSGCCSAFTSVSNCYNPGSTSLGTVSATGLITGQTYILMVDGYAGDVCNFTISGWTAVGILPLELLNFVGHNEDNKNKIQWVTSHEKNTNFFRLEKSKDGIEFEKLLDYNAAGNSQSPKYYNAFDLNPFENISYYRLKLFSLDGTFEYSNVISINNQNLTDYITTARPNPTNGLLEFDVNVKNNSHILIEIYTNTGILINSVVKEVESGYKSIIIDLNKYDSGIYLLKTTFKSTGKSEIQKIIKN